MLNPDGADMYTRLNANEVDLNRDSQNLTQPESKVLREIFDLFQPIVLICMISVQFFE
jgi:murein tripeptide amidase MpaA